MRRAAGATNHHCGGRFRCHACICPHVLQARAPQRRAQRSLTPCSPDKDCGEQGQADPGPHLARALGPLGEHGAGAKGHPPHRLREVSHHHERADYREHEQGRPGAVSRCSARPVGARSSAGGGSAWSSASPWVLPAAPEHHQRPRKGYSANMAGHHHAQTRFRPSESARSCTTPWLRARVSAGVPKRGGVVHKTSAHAAPTPKQPPSPPARLRSHEQQREQQGERHGRDQIVEAGGP